MKYAGIISETIDFKPDNTLEAWYFEDHEPGYFCSIIVGWEIQALTLQNVRTGDSLADQPPLTERPRQYVMIDIDNQGITGEVEGTTNLWKVVPRGTPPPNRDDLYTAWHDWQQRKANMERRAKEYMNRESK